MLKPHSEPFDLQCHSLHSDGTLPAAEVVARAAGAGVRLLALTDHDTVAGVTEALEAGERHGVHGVSGIELSARDPASGHDLHILGYRFDHTDPVLTERLAGFRAERAQRALRMADGLIEQGFALDREGLLALGAAGGSLGRPHLATAVLTHPANAARLHAEGIEELGALIEAYLVPGRPAFHSRSTPTVEQAAALIHAAGGIVVWAHPFWDISDPTEVLATIDRLQPLGLDGVEAFYITHTHPQTKQLAERCAELGLLSTGSADFHGPHNRRFSRFMAFETYDLRPELGAIGET
jgi:3',5'-nucleoside bisphosphate phosphatase